jgi:transposase
MYDKASQVTMVQHWEPGEVLFVDFAGHTMDVTDPHTGEAHTRQIFLATMGHSHLMFAIAVARQTIECFVEAIEKALLFFGGAPRSFVCDNLKSAVIKPDRYDPTLNRVLADLAAHYNMVVMPARVCKPQDKSRVELSVKFFYLRVKAPLRNMNFFSDAELNSAIAEKITASNNTPMQRSGRSRQEVYNNVERDLLQPLPMQRFELKSRRSLMVQKNNHIWLSRDKTHYSAPYIYVGRPRSICPRRIRPGSTEVHRPT